MIKEKILFILVLCLLLVIPASAETLTGTLGVDSGFTTDTYTASGVTGSDSNAPYLFTTMTAVNIQNLKGLKFLIRYDAGYRPTFTNATYAGGTTSFIVKDGVTQIGAGTIGYQRLFSSPGVETDGYQYLSFSSFEPGLLTGNHDLDFTYSTTELNGMFMPTSAARTGWTITPPSGYLYTSCTGGAYIRTGVFELQKEGDFFNTYTATKPLGIGITGSVIKNVGGINYASRVLVYNGSSDALISSETTTSFIPFNFSTRASSIKISIISPQGTSYNSSILFAAAVPTVTPTPTPVIPGAEYNASFIVKNGLTQAVLANVYYEYYTSGENAFNSGLDGMISGYSSATGTFSLLEQSHPIGSNWAQLKMFKSGYQPSEYSYHPSGDFTQVVYMYPDVGIDPTTPESFNLTVRVMDWNGINPISGAYVSAGDSLFGTPVQAQLTNATGYVKFSNFPSSGFIGGVVSKTGYTSNNWFTGYPAMPDVTVIQYLQSSSIVVTPTITPVQYDTMTLTPSANSIALGSSVGLTTTASNATKLTYAGGLRRVLYYVNKNNPAMPFNMELIGVFNNVNATYWQFRQNNDVAFNVSAVLNPLVFSHTPAGSGTYTYSVAAFNSAGLSVAPIANTDVLIGGGTGSGSLIMDFMASDGSNGNRLNAFNITMTDKDTSATTYYDVVYEMDIPLDRGKTFDMSVKSTGYETSTLTFTVPINPAIVAGTFGAIVNVNMFRSGLVTAGNTTITVHTADQETYYPLGNVQITMSGITTPKFTGINGESVYFTIPQNTMYTVTAAKDGYCTATVTQNSSTASTYYLPMYLKYGTCAGTVTPLPTRTVAPTPTKTYTPIINTTPGTVAVCGELPTSATFIEVLKNSLACNGITDLVGQNLALAMLIMLFGGIILGRIAQGIGVLAGVISGAVISMVMGFLPFWIIIVLIILTGLIFAGKVFWSNA